MYIENNEILIHVDSKSNLDDFLFLESKNVTLLTARIDVSWGGVSQINVIYVLFRLKHHIKIKLRGVY